MERKHIVAVSGGKDSTAMALRLRELNPDQPYMFVCTPTGDELPEMFEHWVNVGKILGQAIIPIMRIEGGLNELIAEYGALPNWRQRWCTRQLKIEPYIKFLRDVGPCVSYVGLRADEPLRVGGIWDEVTGIDVERSFPLREWGWGLNDVFRYLKERDVCIPKRTDCARCFFQRLGEWQELLAEHPELYDHAENQEIEIGHTFRSPSRDDWPAGLKALRAEFESGREPRKRKPNPNRCRTCSL